MCLPEFISHPVVPLFALVGSVGVKGGELVELEMSSYSPLNGSLDSTFALSASNNRNDSYCGQLTHTQTHKDTNTLCTQGRNFF